MDSPKKNSFLRKKQWWEGLFANFLGALLGIVVTFGTSGYLEFRDKKAMGRTAALMTISDIEHSIRKLETDCRSFQKYDTIFRAVLSRYPDKLEQVPDDTLFLYVNSFLDDKFFIVDPSAEGIFTHSSEIWRTLDNHTLQQRIGHCFAFRNTLNDFAIDLQKRQRLAAEEFFKEKFFSDRRNTYAAVRELTARPAVRHYLAVYPGDVDFLIGKVRILKRMNERNRQDMHITDAELAKYLEFSGEEYETPDVDE